MNYKFIINDFEGPLDLLLHLIKESKMDIMNIEIVKLTEQYLNFLNQMKNMNLTVASEYLTLASELVYIKSRFLLPREKEELENDLEYIEAKENLMTRLIEYKKYKEISTSFKELENKRKDMFTKAPSNLKEYGDSSIKLGEDVTLNDLLVAFGKYLERKKINEPLITKVTTKEISVEERTNDIKSILRSKKKVEFFELFDNVSKSYVVVTFLSILEMAKNKEIKITQANNFDKIYCEVA